MLSINYTPVKIFKNLLEKESSRVDLRNKKESKIFNEIENKRNKENEF